MSPRVTTEMVATNKMSGNANDQATPLVTTDDPDTMEPESLASNPVANTHFRAWLHEPGVLHDAHWRNGMPSRIQNIAGNQSANFSVMQIGLPNNRDDAARRTSEGIVAAAKTFDRSKYWSTIRKQRQKWLNGVSHTYPSYTPAAAESSTSGAALTQLAMKRTAPLSPQETKVEQARLLTLLRSLNPVVVVDQLCKAAAYFGGIPMAPPPANSGAFPHSDLGNGPGSNFVGWLSEIFPCTTDPSSKSARSDNETTSDETTKQHVPLLSDAGDALFPESAGLAEVPSVAPKRGRGRPKGSKSSKVRSDKGKKHAIRRPRGDSQFGVPDEERSPGDDDTTNVDHDKFASLSQTATLPMRSVTEESTGKPDAPPVPQLRKRGRPKGSKTRLRTKDKADASANFAGSRNDTAIPDNISSSTSMVDFNNPSVNQDQVLQQQFRTDDPNEQSRRTMPSESDHPFPSSAIIEASLGSSRKRKQQLDTTDAEDNIQVAISSQNPETAKRHRVSDVTSRRLETTSQPTSASNSGAQNQGGHINNEVMGNCSTSHIPRYYMTASDTPIHPHLSPNLSQPRPEQSVSQAFTSNNVHMAGQNYYGQQQSMHQSRRQLAPATRSDSAQHQPQHQAKHLATASAGPSAQANHGSQQGYRNIQTQQNALPSSSTSDLSSYSSYGNQSFI